MFGRNDDDDENGNWLTSCTHRVRTWFTRRWSSEEDQGVRIYHHECYPCSWWRMMWDTCARDCCGKRPSHGLMMGLSFVFIVVAVGLFIAGGIYAADYEKTVRYQWHTGAALVLLLIAFLGLIGYKYRIDSRNPDFSMLASEDEGREECLMYIRMGWLLLFAGSGVLLMLFEVVYFWYSPPDDKPQPTDTVPAGFLLGSALCLILALFFRFLCTVFRAYLEREQEEMAGNGNL